MNIGLLGETLTVGWRNISITLTCPAAGVLSVTARITTVDFVTPVTDDGTILLDSCKIMKSADYAQTYASMSDGELARLVSEGRDSLTQQAAKALDDELNARGLNDSLLAHEYPKLEPIGSDRRNAPQFPRRRELIDDVRKLRPWHIVIVVLAFVSTLAFTILRLREAKQDELYGKIVTSFDAPESHTAFNELTKYRGAHARQLILKLATDNSGFIGTVQIDAIRFLAQTGDSEIADHLALLVRPWKGLDVRAAAVDGLVKLPCSAECVHLMLDYKERMLRGDVNAETMLDKEIPNEIREKEGQIDKKLDQVLLKNKQDTLTSLIDVYDWARSKYHLSLCT